MKKALIFGVKSTWDKSNLPSLLLAKYLHKQGYEVTYVFDSMSLFHLWKWKSEKKDFLKEFVSSFISFYLFKGIKCLTSFKIFPDFHKNKIYNFFKKNLNFHYESKTLRDVYRNRYDFCWSSSYREVDAFVKVVSKVKIFSVEDNPYGFNVFSKSFLDNKINILKSSDARFFSTSKLLIEEYFSNASYYSNGIAPHFLMAENSNLKRDPKKCVYVGAIEEWFDWATVNAVFSELADKNYTLDIYGFSNENINEKIKSKNITFLGSVENSEVPAILQNYGTGIIPFKNNDLIKYVNPIKLYEYFSCGLHVIASGWKEITLIRDSTDATISLYKSSNEFQIMLQSSISENQRYINIKYSKEFAYESIFENILNGLNC